MSETTVECVHCEIMDVFDGEVERERRATEARRAEMTAFGRYLDERMEAAYREAEGRFLHQTLHGDYYAPAGGPNAFVGSERRSLCVCGRRP